MLFPALSLAEAGFFRLVSNLMICLIVLGYRQDCETLAGDSLMFAVVQRSATNGLSAGRALKVCTAACLFSKQ